MPEAIPMYDTESEKRQEAHDRAEKIYDDFMRNLNTGDMRDLLERLMDNPQYLVTLLQIMVFTKDAQALLHHHERELKVMMWSLAQDEAEKT